MPATRLSAAAFWNVNKRDRERKPKEALHALLARVQSGDAALVSEFDLEAWVSQWIRVPLRQLGGKTPAEMLRNPEGQRAVEDFLERMRAGLLA